ncbi:protein of unknown function DUF180 [Thermodesulfatator indicus DSM 15286]|uniref:Flagellar assembly factor FliW n=1 Tax=Thermodesulfatator indicus (strain DSM 15286 / JCM 11887 / CIR29812) TaxID=667014 RepID=F8AAQ9_THEID|nr:flagellar assembly protein FliW [Thermodesulfatator indicus]AEH44337.1 protein of unknown function DUF180 [Thermodesulfatator indicus DSM 15286]
MEIETTRFGKIKIEEDKIIFFTSGILGFPEAKRYVLIPHREDSPFLWLQAVDVPELAFVVINPELFFPDYRPEIPEEARKELHIKSNDELGFLTIVTIPKENPADITVNLLGPIAVNIPRKLAKQVVLDARRYPLKEPLRPHLSRFNKSGEENPAQAEAEF